MLGIVTYNAGSDTYFPDSSKDENTATRINATVSNFLMKYRT